MSNVYGHDGLSPIPVPQNRTNEELEKLAARLGATLEGRFSLSWTSKPQIRAKYAGLTVHVIGLSTGYGGETGTAISIMLKLPKPTPYSMKVQNVTSVRICFFTDLEQTDGVPVYNMDDDIARKVLPPETHQMLLLSGLPFNLIIVNDRVVLTVYGSYQHEVYLELLEILSRVCTSLMEV